MPGLRFGSSGGTRRLFPPRGGMRAADVGCERACAACAACGNAGMRECGHACMRVRCAGVCGMRSACGNADMRACGRRAACWRRAGACGCGLRVACAARGGMWTRVADGMRAACGHAGGNGRWLPLMAIGCLNRRPPCATIGAGLIPLRETNAAGQGFRRCRGDDSAASYPFALTRWEIPQVFLTPQVLCAQALFVPAHSLF